jgi:hypothetical protein
MANLTIDEIKDLLLFCKANGVTAIEVDKDGGLKACVNPAESLVVPDMPHQEPYKVPDWES